MKEKGTTNSEIERVKSNNILENYTNICIPSPCHWELKQGLIRRCKPTPGFKAHPAEQGHYSAVSGVLLGQELSVGSLLPIELSLPYQSDVSGLVFSAILLFCLIIITKEWENEIVERQYQPLSRNFLPRRPLTWRMNLSMRAMSPSTTPPSPVSSLLLAEADSASGKNRSWVSLTSCAATPWPCLTFRARASILWRKRERIEPDLEPLWRRSSCGKHPKALGLRLVTFTGGKCYF